jgi:hypothetical protein
MGRPLRKDILGVDAINTFTGAETGVRVEIYDTQLRDDGVIIKQRGAKTFTCTRVGDIADGDTFAKYVLVSDSPNAAGEMSLFGWNPSNGGSRVNLRKITKRVATDWSGNKYTWILQNDSSNDYIVLTPIA